MQAACPHWAPPAAAVAAAATHLRWIVTIRPWRGTGHASLTRFPRWAASMPLLTTQLALMVLTVLVAPLPPGRLLPTRTSTSLREESVKVVSFRTVMYTAVGGAGGVA